MDLKSLNLKVLTQIDRLTILQVLKTFNGIAKHYNMPLLKSVSEWSMKMNGWDVDA